MQHCGMRASSTNTTFYKTSGGLVLMDSIILVSYPLSDVVYNGTDDKWACCGAADNEGHPACSNPTDETFSISPLMPLLAKAGRVISSTTSLSTASVTATSNTSAAHNSSSPANHDLSDGAKIGIGIGAGLGAIALLASFGWLIILSRRLQRLEKEKETLSRKPPTEEHSSSPHQLPSAVSREDPRASRHAYEIDNRQISELAGHR
jgi:hypothetical protein